ncbi:MAG: sulfite exporter TauE/SafE family protein [Pseudomonadales bacterium]|nr:sulfite exporter TauE/SafE family protein [Pseudomonadales bacterium]
MPFVSYMLLGACAGTLAGLFGVGGGIIIVPALVIAFELQGMSPEILTHMAVGTSLATIVFTSISSIRTHHQKQGVLWPIFKPLSVGIVVGAVLGVFTAGALPGDVLQMVIGIFALLIAAQMGFGLAPKASRSVPGDQALIGVGGGIGWASAIFGIGGGSLTVPFLSWCNVRMQQAVGTSAACGLPIAVAGALTNVVEGWGNPALPDLTTGYLYWPGLVGIVLTSVIFARFGANLAHKLSPTVLKKIFALLLVVVGSKFLFF